MTGPLLREATPASDVVVILVLGDSFTAGLGVPRNAAFPAQLEARLRAQGEAVRVVDKGVSGDTTAGALSRVDRALADDKPAFVILELGANDALRGIQPFEVHAHLNEIITKIQASGTRLLLTGMRAPLNWGEEYRIAFDRIFPDLARARRVPLYPFFLQGVARDPRLNQPDRLHPNEQGVRVLVDHIAPIVAYLIREEGTGQIPVATVDGILSMDEQEYRRYTKDMGNLPELPQAYIFGTKIRRPSMDSQGHIHVSIGPAGISAGQPSDALPE
jgi:acyl-CoA thioesterase-1